MLKSKSPRLVVRPNPGRSTAMPPVRSSSGSHRSLLVGTPWTYRTSAPGALRQNTGWPSSSSRCSVVAVNAGRPYWRAMRTLCIGEALVDLICERPVAGLEAAGAFVPHPGGVAANACVIASRLGGEVALAGGGGGAGGRRRRRRVGPLAARAPRGRGRRAGVVHADRGHADRGRLRHRRPRGRA